MPDITLLPLRRFAGLLLLTALYGCAPTSADHAAGGAGAAPPAAPPGAPAGTCWDRHISPAVIETVTVQVLDRAEQRGPEDQIIQPAVFRTETRQDIVRPRSESWLEIPCPEAMTPEFIASVQRALSARDLYHGPINGRMDRNTRTAIHRYQDSSGLQSSTLSLAAARRLGLVAVLQ